MIRATSAGHPMVGPDTAAAAWADCTVSVRTVRRLRLAGRADTRNGGRRPADATRRPAQTVVVYLGRVCARPGGLAGPRVD